MYRIKSQRLSDDYYIYYIELKTKFLFFSYWKRQAHKLLYSQKEAEDYLPFLLAEKEASKKIKYYHIIGDEISSGNSESEAIKKFKLRAFS
jgi:hypothetical protein